MWKKRSADKRKHVNLPSMQRVNYDKIAINYMYMVSHSDISLIIFYARKNAAHKDELSTSLISQT